MYTYRFDWEGLTLPVHQATLHYVGGVDPTLRWKKRGRKSHSVNETAEEKLNRSIQQATRHLQTTEGQRELEDYLDDTLTLFHDLLTKPDGLERHFPDRRFVFVAGPLRTGGTYLLTEFCNVLEIPWQSLEFRMLHDSIPTPEYLAYLDRPGSWLPLSFELAQFLVWVKREISSDTLVKKRIHFGHALSVLDSLFGDRAEYYIPVRHPAGIASSASQLLENFHTEAPKPEKRGWDRLVRDRTPTGEQEWRSMSYEQRVLAYWGVYYRDVARQAPLAGRLQPVLFGEDSVATVEAFAQRRGREYDPDSFTPTEREYDPFWKTPEVSETLVSVQRTWDRRGWDFPEPPLL